MAPFHPAFFHLKDSLHHTFTKLRQRTAQLMWTSAVDLVKEQTKVAAKSCGDCLDGITAPFSFSMAFQPVVDLAARRIYAYEALVRGPNGESAARVLDQVTLANRYAFDQSCRMKAIALASHLGLVQSGAKLSINFIPGAMYKPENCVRATLTACRRYRFPTERLIFELTENEKISDFGLLAEIFRVYRANRFACAIDDFGAGFSGLALLAQFQPDVVKIDMLLLRNVDSDRRRHAIVEGIVGICRSLSTEVVAEGVETQDELAALRSMGITLFQGYLFAKPGFESLPNVAL